MRSSKFVHLVFGVLALLAVACGRESAQVSQAAVAPNAPETQASRFENMLQAATDLNQTVEKELLQEITPGVFIIRRDAIRSVTLDRFYKAARLVDDEVANISEEQKLATKERATAVLDRLHFFSGIMASTRKGESIFTIPGNEPIVRDAAAAIEKEMREICGLSADAKLSECNWAVDAMEQNGDVVTLKSFAKLASDYFVLKNEHYSLKKLSTLQDGSADVVLAEMNDLRAAAEQANRFVSGSLVYPLPVR